MNASEDKKPMTKCRNWGRPKQPTTKVINYLGNVKRFMQKLTKLTKTKAIR